MERMHREAKRDDHHFCFQETRVQLGRAAPPTSRAGKAGFTMHAAAAAVTGEGALEHSGGAATRSWASVGARPLEDDFPERVRLRLIAQL
eukprot:739150-Pyramimonas_sp.AAC.1